MSDFEPDPSASTGRFRAFVEGGEEEAAPRRFAVSPAVAAVAAVAAVVIVAIVLIVALA
jgi:hypothetical protein